MNDSGERIFPPGPAASSRSARILVIDDEAPIGWVLTRVLRDHQVTCETDARKALARLGQGDEFDLILCDLMMPGMTGMDFFRELLVAHPTLSKRVVFMTGGVFSRETERFLESVENRQLGKPFAADVLRAIVAEFIG